MLLFVLFAVVAMPVTCISVESPQCKVSTHYVGVTYCGNGDLADVIAQSKVTSRAECAQMCSEERDCKAMDIQWSDDEINCRLVRDQWPSESCPPSTSFYNKRCLNDGELLDGKCRCVGGYVGMMCENIMKDCSDGYESGPYRTNGVYKVWPTSAPSPFLVYCYMTDKSGKTLIQRQTVDGGVNFNRLWDDYDVGFGDLSGDHWLGNTFFHYLTQKDPLPALTMGVKTGNSWRHRYYFKFNLTDKNNLFKYDFAWSETEAEEAHSLGDCLVTALGFGFSTPDNDNDGATSNCAERRESGFWFDKCLRCNMNAKVTGLPYSKETDVNWYPGLDQSLAITATEITV